MLAAALGCVVVLAQAGAVAPVVEKPTLLVMPLRSEPKLAETARALDELVLEAVAGLKRYSVLGPGDINALIGAEKMKDALGCDDTSCAAEIGGALGAPFLLAGELRALGDQVVLSLRLMDTKKREVLSRATARGAKTGDALPTIMATAVGGCFGTTIETKGQVAAPAGDTDYSGYMALMTELTGYSQRNEYTALLAKLGDIETRAKKVKGPAGGVSIEELIVYYKGLACFTLKKPECLGEAAKRYAKDWPAGSYRTGIDGFVTMFDDQKTARADHEAEVTERIADIRTKAKAGTYDANQADEMIAYAYYGGQDYAKAAVQFGALLDRLYAEKPPKTDKIMSLTGNAVFAWQQVGNFEACRAALKRAEALDAKAYRGANLHQTERSLPK